MGEESGGYSKFVVSSVKDIQTVFDFFSWINDFRQSSRYCHLRLPK